MQHLLLIWMLTLLNGASPTEKYLIHHSLFSLSFLIPAQSWLFVCLFFVFVFCLFFFVFFFVLFCFFISGVLSNQLHAHLSPLVFVLSYSPIQYTLPVASAIHSRSTVCYRLCLLLLFSILYSNVLSSFFLSFSRFLSLSVCLSLSLSFSLFISFSFSLSLSHGASVNASGLTPSLSFLYTTIISQYCCF